MLPQAGLGRIVPCAEMLPRFFIMKSSPQPGARGTVSASKGTAEIYSTRRGGFFPLTGALSHTAAFVGLRIARAGCEMSSGFLGTAAVAVVCRSRTSKPHINVCLMATVHAVCWRGKARSRREVRTSELTCNGLLDVHCARGVTTHALEPLIDKCARSVSPCGDQRTQHPNPTRSTPPESKAAGHSRTRQRQGCPHGDTQDGTQRRESAR